MWKKIFKVAEKVLLVLFWFSLLTIVASDIDTSLFSDSFINTVEILILVFIAGYVAIASAISTSNLVLMLTATYSLSVLANLIRITELVEVPSMLLVLIFSAALVLMVKSIFIIKTNVFLKIVVIFIPIFLFIYLLSVFQHAWVEKNWSYVLFPVFIIVSTGFIFGLPNSDFPAWSPEHKKVFIRYVLSVWFLVLVLSSSQILVRDSSEYRKMFFPKTEEYWWMKEYRLEGDPGLPG